MYLISSVCLCTSLSLQDPDLQFDERVSEAAAVLPLTAQTELMTAHVKLTVRTQRSDLTVTHSAVLHHVNQTPDRETHRCFIMAGRLEQRHQWMDGWMGCDSEEIFQPVNRRVITRLRHAFKSLI